MDKFIERITKHLEEHSSIIEEFKNINGHCGDYDSACDCTCSNSLEYSNCDKKCKRYVYEREL